VGEKRRQAEEEGVMKKTPSRVHLLDVMDTANHEAGHAVIAAHFHIPFRDAAVVLREGDVIKTELGGQVRGSFSDSLCTYATRVAKKGLPFADLERRILRRREQLIIMFLAGRAAEEMFATGTVPAESTSDDEEAIRVLQDGVGISDARVTELGRRAERLVRLPYIKAAIISISAQLHAEKAMTARQVRGIYRDHKKFASVYRRAMK
jgi:hypothetical protein